jgi:hypothetical protein
MPAFAETAEDTEQTVNDKDKPDTDDKSMGCAELGNANSVHGSSKGDVDQILLALAASRVYSEAEAKKLRLLSQTDPSLFAMQGVSNAGSSLQSIASLSSKQEKVDSEPGTSGVGANSALSITQDKDKSGAQSTASLLSKQESAVGSTAGSDMGMSDVAGISSLSATQEDKDKSGAQSTASLWSNLGVLSSTADSKPSTSQVTGNSSLSATQEDKHKSSSPSATSLSSKHENAVSSTADSEPGTSEPAGNSSLSVTQDHKDGSSTASLSSKQENAFSSTADSEPVRNSSLSVSQDPKDGSGTQSSANLSSNTSEVAGNSSAKEVSFSALLDRISLDSEGGAEQSSPPKKSKSGSTEEVSAVSSCTEDNNRHVEGMKEESSAPGSSQQEEESLEREANKGTVHRDTSTLRRRQGEGRQVIYSGASAKSCVRVDIVKHDLAALTQASPDSLQLTDLPLELLHYLTKFLDNFSLCNLSLVCRGLRGVCATLLQDRGVVSLVWGKEHDSLSAPWRVVGKVRRLVVCVMYLCVFACLCCVCVCVCCVVCVCVSCASVCVCVHVCVCVCHVPMCVCVCHVALCVCGVCVCVCV